MSKSDEHTDPEPTDAAVANAGEPSGSTDAREGRSEARRGPAPADLDAREERFTRPRKAMGPTEEDDDDVPETTPEEP